MQYYFFNTITPEVRKPKIIKETRATMWELDNGTIVYGTVSDRREDSLCVRGVLTGEVYMINRQYIRLSMGKTIVGISYDNTANYNFGYVEECFYALGINDTYACLSREDELSREIPNSEKMAHFARRIEGKNFTKNSNKVLF